MIAARTVRRWTALLASVAALTTPALASAHAGLVSTTRVNSGEVRLTFSAPIEARFVVATELGPVDATIARAVRSADDPNSVVVRVSSTAPALSWQVLSQDGHTSSGIVDLPGSLPIDRGTDWSGLALTAGDLLGLLGVLGLIGLVAARAWMIAPAWSSGGIRPPGRERSALVTLAPAGERATRTWWRTWWALFAFALAGVVLSAIGTYAAVDPVPTGRTELITGTRWGTAWWIGLAALVAVAGAALVVRRGPASRSLPLSTPAALALTGPLAIGAIATSWAGHASSGNDRALGIGLDAVHGLATAVWLGGLAALLAVVVHMAGSGSDDERTRFLAAAVVRFSAVAIVCVALLVVTGAYRAIAELDAWSDLMDSAYGQWLLVKLAVFGGLLVAGVINRLVFHPRLERAALGLRAGDGGAAGALRGSICAELVLAAVVLVAVAVMVNLPPPR